jgi:predicted CoA-binding protein
MKNILAYYEFIKLHPVYFKLTVFHAPIYIIIYMDIRTILTTSKTVAVVGISPDSERASHRVASYLQSVGYRIVPVRPDGEEILGEKVYRSLRDIPFQVDIVDVFRKPEAVPPIANEAIEIGAGTLWLQEGVANPEAEAMARKAGLAVVSDRCMLKEHRRLGAR